MMESVGIIFKDLHAASAPSDTPTPICWGASLRDMWLLCKRCSSSRISKMLVGASSSQSQLVAIIIIYYIILVAIIFSIIIIPGLNARRSPVYHLFLTRRVSQLLGLALVSWAFARVGVHRPSLRLPYLLFSIRSYLPLNFNRVFSSRPTYRHPFCRPFTYSLFR